MVERSKSPFFVKKFRLSGEGNQDREIIENLTRNLRTRARLSQSELAERLGITQARIAQMETEPTSVLTVERLAEVAKACGLEVVVEFREKEKSELNE